MEFFKKILASIIGENKVPVDVEDKSPKGKVDSVDVAKIVRDALIVAVASGIAYVLKDESIVQSLGPVSVVVLAAVLNFVQKLMKDNGTSTNETTGV